MGDPKKTRRKYTTPSHPWQKARIEEEKILKKEYGLKNKKEIWVIASKINKFKDQLKKLDALSGAQADKEREQLRNKLMSVGLITANDSLDKVLSLETKDLMERRLQTMVFKKGLAKSVGQARQFIVHRHITVCGKQIDSPSHIVKASEEGNLGFLQGSTLADPNHPERFVELPKDREVKKKDDKKKAEVEIAAFDEVPEDEEAILKEALVKKKESEETPAEKTGEGEQ